jgi:histidyl-tRNA synthetase
VNQKCHKLAEEVPQRVDFLCQTCHSHLFKLLEILEDVEVPYVIDNAMVRDEAYYNSTVYDIYQGPSDEATTTPTTPVVLARGGRCNYIIEMIGGPVTHGATMTVVLETVLGTIRAEQAEIPKASPPHVYLAQLSEQAIRKAMSFLRDLRREDFRVVANFAKDSLKSQLDSATRMGARIVLIMGQREVVDGTILMRDMDSGIQEVVNIKKIVEEIKKKIYGQKKK